MAVVWIDYRMNLFWSVSTSYTAAVHTSVSSASRHIIKGSLCVYRHQILLSSAVTETMLGGLTNQFCGVCVPKIS